MNDFVWPVSPTFRLRRIPKDGAKVDCYVSVASDIAVFAPIVHTLRTRNVDACLVLEPPLRNTAQGLIPDAKQGYRINPSCGGLAPMMTPEAYQHCLEILQERQLDWLDRARPGADAALTSGTIDALDRYTGVKIKLVAEMSFLQDSNTAENECSGFDGALAPGPFTAARLRRQLPAEAVYTVGFLKQAAADNETLAGVLPDYMPDRPLVVYFPGCGENSSIEDFAQALSGLTDSCTVCCIPHQRTLLFERERVHHFIAQSAVSVIEGVAKTDMLLRAADLIVADAHSPMAAEALRHDKPLVLAIHPDNRTPPLQEGLEHVFAVCRGPARLAELVHDQLQDPNIASDARSAWRALLFADHQGNEPGMAADAVLDIIKHKERFCAQVSQLRFDGLPSQETIISVVIPTYNRCDILATCLEALAAQSFPRDRFEVLLCDDGSTDDTSAFLESYAAPFALRYLRQENRGPAAARNMGLQQARGRFVLLLNDDAIAAPDLLENHYKAQLLFAGERLAILGSFSFPEAYQETLLGHLLEEGGYLFAFNKNMRPHQRYNYLHFYTCNISLERGMLEAVGGFDGAFKLPAGEDTEIGRRLAVQCGCQVFHAPECATRHEHPQTIEMFCRTQYTRGLAQPLLYATHPDILPYKDQRVVNKTMRYHLATLNAAKIQAMTDKFKALEAPSMRDAMTRSSLGAARFHKTALTLAPMLKAISDFHFIKGQLDSPHMPRLIEALDAKAAEGAAHEQHLNDFEGGGTP